MLEQNKTDDIQYKIEQAINKLKKSKKHTLVLHKGTVCYNFHDQVITYNNKTREMSFAINEDDIFSFNSKSELKNESGEIILISDESKKYLENIYLDLSEKRDIDFSNPGNNIEKIKRYNYVEKFSYNY